MTRQLTDNFSYRGKPFSLAGICGTGLFRAHEHGMELAQAGTFCYRGYVADYEVWDDTRSDPLASAPRTILRLADLRVRPRDIDTLPLLMYGAPLEFIQRPEIKPDVVNDINIYDAIFPCHYRHCPDPVPFTGGLLLGANLITKITENMGYPAAWKYRKVYELIFEDGVLTEEHDRSAQLAKMRREFSRSEPGSAQAGGHLASIVRSFSLDYERGAFG
jgi:hypothetical protein